MKTISPAFLIQFRYMKKYNRAGNISWVNISKGVAISIGILAIVAGIIFAVFAYRANQREERLEEMKVILKDIQRRVYERQNAGFFGGKTPAETIYLYYEFLESRDFPLLSTYFVPEKRTEELSRFAGVSEREILAFVEELRAAELLARTADPRATTFTMDSPVNLGMKRMENGVWEFEYINREFKSP